SEALDRHPRRSRIEASLARELADRDPGAAPGRLLTPLASAHEHGLPGDDSGRLDAMDRLVLVAHPAHDARVRVDVGRRDVRVRTDDVSHGSHVRARQTLELESRELFG